ncbi:transcriptional regulator of arginine metabolism [Weissella uvarum]|uniref:arginine repressor n=1 Tax=Weissella uvarum TaxID=1479233 RepID=UPI00195FC16F|nr:arginine catabolic regulator [Weissella uvarum]MBM7616474.1 transcriptional regulator of arginine metabolism [Weissella uvarum]MCM0595065.1 arginine catabolic regulator [Weissella uvarum]
MVRNKQARQAAIKSIIETQNIQKQEDLVQALNDQGWQVTQATISRDVAQMQLTKVPQTDGRFKYAVLTDDSSLNQLKAIIAEPESKIAHQDNLVYIQVAPGSGPALKAIIDAIAFDEVFGTMSDDASVLMILRSNVNGADFIQNL